MPSPGFDLFGTPHFPGLAARDDFVAADEERRLIAAIDGLDLHPFRFQGWLGKRLTTSFGWRYDFDDASFTRGRRCPTGCCRCAIGRRTLPGWRRARSSMRC